MKYLFYYRFKNFMPECNLLESAALVYAILEEDGYICGIFPKGSRKIPKDAEEKETPLIKQATKQLQEYFNKNRRIFDLPLKPEGTEFQLKVWNALQKIPYGKTCSYKEIAAKTGNPKANRAVGMANNRNPIHIIIPCHRVIGANGSLTGYASDLEIKQLLLKLELEKTNKNLRAKNA